MEVGGVSECDDFVASTISRQVLAETAIHNGNAAPRTAMWSPKDPVTLFGAERTNTGWDAVKGTFSWLASRFSDCTSYDLELVAAGASGDLAYTVGYEHTTTTVAGAVHSYTLRVTHVYRREDGEWKIVHRHGDRVPQDQGSPAEGRDEHSLGRG